MSRPRLEISPKSAHPACATVEIARGSADFPGFTGWRLAANSAMVAGRHCFPPRAVAPCDAAKLRSGVTSAGRNARTTPRVPDVLGPAGHFHASVNATDDAGGPTVFFLRGQRFTSHNVREFSTGDYDEAIAVASPLAVQDSPPAVASARSAFAGVRACRNLLQRRRLDRAPPQPRSFLRLGALPMGKCRRCEVTRRRLARLRERGLLRVRRRQERGLGSDESDRAVIDRASPLFPR